LFQTNELSGESIISLIVSEGIVPVLEVLQQKLNTTIEEIIFRGFLFKMMEKDNLKSAMIVSAITFGIGFLFVIIFYKSKSLIPCIVTHAVVNSLSLFNGIDSENEELLYIGPVVLIAVSVIYAVYIIRTVKE